MYLATFTLGKQQSPSASTGLLGFLMRGSALSLTREAYSTSTGLTNMTLTSLKSAVLPHRPWSNDGAASPGLRSCKRVLLKLSTTKITFATER